MKNNYIYKTAACGPALSGATLLHAVNNVWDDVNGHVIEGGEKTARGIFEGNVFIKVKQLVSDYQGKLFSSPDVTTNAQCESALGRAREANVLEETTNDFCYSDTSFVDDFKGLSIASAEPAGKIKSSVPSNAGAGKLSFTSSSSAAKAVPDEAAQTAQPAEITTATSVVSATHFRARVHCGRLRIRDRDQIRSSIRPVRWSGLL